MLLKMNMRNSRTPPMNIPIQQPILIVVEPSRIPNASDQPWVIRGQERLDEPWCPEYRPENRLGMWPLWEPKEISAHSNHNQTSYPIIEPKTLRSFARFCAGSGHNSDETQGRQRSP